MTRTAPVDWTELLRGLLKAGVTITTIAKALDVKHQTVSKWWNGETSPSYDNGVRLTGYWMLVLGLDYTLIPRTSAW